MAGGLGTRLGEITRRVPKPMVLIAGVPYLEHQIRLLALQNITNVILLTGYLGEQIETYFGTGRRFGLSIGYSRETSPLGTGGALREASPLLDDAFLVIYGDSYLPIDYRAVYHYLEKSKTQAVAVVYDNQADTSVPNNIGLDAEGIIYRYDKGALDRADLHYVEAGVLALKREVLAHLPSSGPASLENLVFPRLIELRLMRGFVTCQRFYDIGTPDRIRQFEAFLQS